MNSKIARFCQSATAVCSTALTRNTEQEPIVSIYSLIEQAELLMYDIEAWHSSIPGHWKQQYHPEHRADSNIPPPDPWTTIFLAVNHATQVIFYLQVLKCLHTVEHLDPEPKRWPLEARPSEYRQMIECRIRYLINIICFTVRSNVGEMDANEQFNPGSNAMSGFKFANNTLYWPMQVVVDCPLSTTAQKMLCRNALHYIRPATGNRMVHPIGGENVLPVIPVP